MRPLLKIKEYYLFREFPNQGLICAFSTRALGNMSLFYGDIQDSLNNRKNFLRDLGIDYRGLLCAKQVHGSNVGYVEENDKGKGALSYSTCIPDTDALITDKKNLALAVFTADCLSIFLYDSKTSGIALIHAGWRSTKEGIISKTVKLMQERFNTQVKNLYAGLGPAIRDCCYEVGREFSEPFPYGLLKRDNRYYLDLVGINKKQLLDIGVSDTYIYDSGICTSCRNEEFFSHRKEGNRCGRMMSVIMTKETTVARPIK
jgi:YfiH family protein